MSWFRGTPIQLKQFPLIAPENLDGLSAASLDHLHHRSNRWGGLVYFESSYWVAGFDHPFSKNFEIVSGSFRVEKSLEDDLGSKSFTLLVAGNARLSYRQIRGTAPD